MIEYRDWEGTLRRETAYTFVAKRVSCRDGGGELENMQGTISNLTEMLGAVLSVLPAESKQQLADAWGVKFIDE